MRSVIQPKTGVEYEILDILSRFLKFIDKYD